GCRPARRSAPATGTSPRRSIARAGPGRARGGHGTTRCQPCAGTRLLDRDATGRPDMSTPTHDRLSAWPHSSLRPNLQRVTVKYDRSVRAPMLSWSVAYLHRSRNLWPTTDDLLP